MTERNRTIIRAAGTLLALAGLGIQFAGYQSASFLNGKSVPIGSTIVVIGLVIMFATRRKASV